MINYATNPMVSLLAANNGGGGTGPGDAPGAIDKPPGKATLYLPPDTMKPTRIDDKRKVVGATGVPFSERYSKAGNYDTAFMQNIIRAAKFNKVDPNLALAVALQETGMGKVPIDQVVHAVYDKAPNNLDQGAFELTKMLQDKMREGQRLGFQDEAHQIQMFNGMGKLFPRTRVNGVLQPENYYGVRVTADNPLDMRKNPVYGKTIQDLRDNVMRLNPSVQTLIQNTQ